MVNTRKSPKLYERMPQKSLGCQRRKVTTEKMRMTREIQERRKYVSGNN